MWNHQFLIVRARGPGVLYVYHYQRLHLLYARGDAHWDITVGRLQAVLRDRAGLEPMAADLLCHVVERMVLPGHGGTVLVTDPDSRVDSKLLDFSYNLSEASSILKDAVQAEEAGHHDGVSHALDFVARLSQVDGVVHITSDLAIHGFGGKISLDVPPGLKVLAEDAPLTFDDMTWATRELRLSEIAGMRHQSACLFCATQAGQALAIVVSQDGDVTLFGRQDDGTVVRVGPFALGAGLAVS